MTQYRFMATVISMLGIAGIVIAEIEGQPGSTAAPSVVFGYQVPPDASGFRAPPTAKPYEIVSRFWFLRFESIRGRVNFTQIVVPWWFLFFCTGAFPGLLLMGIVKSCWCRRRFRNGCCQVCGYDLRATPDRCPECGTKVTAWTDRAHVLERV